MPPFINLDGFPQLQEFHLSATRSSNFGDDFFADPLIVRGRSSSLRRLIVEGAFYFDDYVSLKDWLIQLSAKTLVSLSLNGIRFPHLSPHWSTWPKMPNLRSLELHGIMLSHFSAFPCGGLCQLYVSSETDLNDDALRAMLQSARHSLEVLSVVRRPFIRRDLVLSSLTVDALARCLKLRHLELVGMCCGPEDWKFLWHRVFLLLDQLHIETWNTSFPVSQRLALGILLTCSRIYLYHPLQIYRNSTRASSTLRPQTRRAGSVMNHRLGSYGTNLASSRHYLSLSFFLNSFASIRT
jgi:hypothetical protein